jgi:hypothetical protein
MGLVPWLQGVLPTKTPTTEELPRLFSCELKFDTMKNNKEAEKTSLASCMNVNFTKVTTC